MLKINSKFQRLNFIIIFCILSISNSTSVFSSESSQSPEFKFGFHLGLSTPNQNINDIYNNETVQKPRDDIYKLLRESAKLGYHIGIRGRFYINDTYQLTGTLLWNRFSESKIDVKDPSKNDTIIQTLFTHQNIANIGAGMNIAFNSGFIRFYGSGELNFNYMYNSVDLQLTDGIQLPLSLSPSYSRVGIGIGAGTDFDLKIIILNLEAKYYITNIIGQDDNERIKAFLVLSAGIYF